MREMRLTFLIILLIAISVGNVFALEIDSVYDLWNIPNTGLGETYTLTKTLDLTATKTIVAWNSTTPYQIGAIVKHTNNYAYEAILASTDKAPTGETDDNWSKMWLVSDKGWTPIGTSSAPFHGNFDGGNFEIQNLYINRRATSIGSNGPTGGQNLVGLFGHVSNGTTATDASTLNSADIYIQNVKMTNVDITGQRGTGALIGKVMLPDLSGKVVYVQNCSSTGTVTGFGAVGGLVGANNSKGKQSTPIIRSCSSSVTVTSTHPGNTTRNPDEFLDSWNFNTFWTPYNIKYGGLVGCNENGITQDCFATGAVSGGDRVGGLAGCTIGGGIFRSYATGKVTQGISSGTPNRNWPGGAGPLVGLVSGDLPFGLGGATAVGAVEDSYYILGETGNTSNDYGTALPAGNTFPNWDHTLVWTTANPPLLAGGVSPTYHYQATTDGNWFSTVVWKSSETMSNYNTDSSLKPNYSNSLSIDIPSGKTVTITNDETANVSKTTVGGTLTINSGGTLNVQKNNNADTDLTVSGTLTVNGDMNIGQSASASVTGTMNIGSTAKIAVAGALVLDNAATINITDGSSITFNGDVIQAIPSLFTTFHDLEINNFSGVNFPNPNIVVNGMFTQTEGDYTKTNSPAIDGFSSPDFKRLSWDETEHIIGGFSATTEVTEAYYPDSIKRSWSINGTISTDTKTKAITFYWDETDDNGFNWSGHTPYLYSSIPAKAEPIAGESVVVDGTTAIRSATFQVPIGDDTNGKELKIGPNAGSTLPVELSSFTAFNQQGSTVMLQWITQSESNLDGYRLFRNDSNSLDTSVMLDAFFPGTNTSQTQSYSYLDESITANGVYYYWIQMLDYDGTNSFYGPAILEINDDFNNSVDVAYKTGFVSIYPNPFNPTTSFRYYLEAKSNVALQIYNIKGQLVKDFNLGTEIKGFHTVVWNGKNNDDKDLPSGVYFTKMKTNDKTDLRKIILMK